MVTGGIGLAPLRPAIERLIADRDRYGEVSLLYGARSPDEMLYATELRAWREAGIAVETTVDSAAADSRWRRDLAVAYAERGEARRRAGQRAAAATDFRAALALITSDLFSSPKARAM